VADQTLIALQGAHDLFCVVLRFEMTALRLLGHAPALRGCAACGESIELSGRVPFGQMAGGLLCPRCRPGQRQVVSLTADAVRVLQQFATGSLESWQEVAVDAKIRGELRGLMNQYLCNLLDHRPRMHQYLGLLGHAPE